MYIKSRFRADQTRLQSHQVISEIASERGGNNLKGLKDFYLNAKATKITTKTL